MLDSLKKGFKEHQLWFTDTYGRPVLGPRRDKRGDSNTSDQGTGDEATLPRTEELRPVKKKYVIRRSRSTQRSPANTPKVPTEIHKKQLFSGRKSSKYSEQLGIFIRTVGIGS